MEKPYSVCLHGVEGVPAAEKITAEIRFIKELERGLGNTEAVVEVYRAWRDACECDASELSPQTSTLAVKWPKAFDAAQRAGLKSIGEGDGHFELRLERQNAETD